MPGAPQSAIALGLMARWASASSDSDLTGAGFPAWLSDILGRRYTTALADRRGECIHSGCSHYHKCFVERSIRSARTADIVIANHALVMIQAVMQAGNEGAVPTAIFLMKAIMYLMQPIRPFRSLSQRLKPLNCGYGYEGRRWPCRRAGG